MWIHPTPEGLTEHHEERVAHLRLVIHGVPGQRPHVVRRRPVRRWVGRQLVRVGERLAADPSLRPVRSL
ncbi:MAG TPA: hypothetical protein VFH63_00240 [candidate division Zixibacteria bacterium]|nr:hypothetical protein [candidate division Zixibacteria bacterium]